LPTVKAGATGGGRAVLRVKILPTVSSRLRGRRTGGLARKTASTAAVIRRWPDLSGMRSNVHAMGAAEACLNGPDPCSCNPFRSWSQRNRRPALRCLRARTSARIKKNPRSIFFAGLMGRLRLLGSEPCCKKRSRRGPAAGFGALGRFRNDDLADCVVVNNEINHVPFGPNREVSQICSAYASARLFRGAGFCRRPFVPTMRL